MSLSSVEGYLDFDEHQIYFRIYQDASSKSGRPLIIVHGGPAFGHNYLLSLRALASTPGVSAVVFYDQIGCGKSSKVPSKDGDRTFWNLALLTRELQHLAQSLKNILGHEGSLSYDVLGHSTGALIAALFAAERPQGLCRLVLSNGMASWELFNRSCMELLERMPNGHNIIDFEEHALGRRATCATSQEQYMAAINEFRTAHAIRAPPPYPQDLLVSLGNMQNSIGVFKTFAGATVEAVWGGSLISETSIPVLSSIRASTLIIGGRWDKASEKCSQPFFDLIPRVKWIVLETCSHFPGFEDPQRYETVIGGFLSIP